MLPATWGRIVLALFGCAFSDSAVPSQLERCHRLLTRRAVEVEIYSITGHKPGDVQAILTTQYLPRDAEVAGNAISKLNRYKARGDQKEDGILPTALPTARIIAKVKTEKA